MCQLGSEFRENAIFVSTQRPADNDYPCHILWNFLCSCCWGKYDNERTPYFSNRSEADTRNISLGLDERLCFLHFQPAKREVSSRGLNQQTVEAYPVWKDR